jgi:NADH:ubiquinone oxidoreductase subunit F (NADH-binding)
MDEGKRKLDQAVGMLMGVAQLAAFGSRECFPCTECRNAARRILEAAMRLRAEGMGQ